MISEQALCSTIGIGIVHICHECCKPQNENILNQIIGRTLQKRPKLFRKYCKADSEKRVAQVTEASQNSQFVLIIQTMTIHFQCLYHRNH